MSVNYLLDYLSKLNPISQEFHTYVEQNVKEEYFSKNQVILSPGQAEGRMWYIIRGFAMEYSYKDIDKKPYRFWNEGEMMVNISSFFRQTASKTYIEMVEPCTLLAITYEQLQYMLREFPETKILMRHIIEHYQNDAEEKAFELLMMSSEERFQRLLQTYPLILEKTSIDNIAGYLGISKKTLSRIRTKNSQK